MEPIDLIRQGKIKRFFRATKKLNVPNMVFHITQRAAGKEPLFLEDGDYLFMLGLMKEISKNRSLNMYAFCLMPNHLHLLFSPANANLYDTMRDLFSKYARNFNRKYERKGHLFGGPYRQAVCLDDSYLLAASLYIHLNPVKAGLAPDPLSYRWSSCRLYCDSEIHKSFVNPNFILDLLPKTVGAKEEYRLLLQRGTDLEVGQISEQEDTIDRFRSKLASLFPSAFTKLTRRKQVLGQSGTDLLSVEELEELIEQKRNGRTRSTPEGRKAKKYLVEQLIARGYKQTEIAEKLGVSRKTIYNILNTK
jgi:putative transposase